MTAVELYSFCYNEIDILPWSVDYWKEFADKAIVFDNGSTDGSVEFLSQFPWVEVRHFETDGMDDEVVRYIKNNAWKGSDADWVVVCDMDEHIYCPKGVRHILNEYTKASVGIVYPKWFVLSSDEVPQYNGELLHRVRPYWVPLQKEAKPMLFQPRLVKEMNFSAGQHFSSPELSGRCLTVNGGSIYCLHSESRLSSEYYLERMRKSNERRSSLNIQMGYGTHYARSEEEILAQLDEYKEKAIILDI